VTFGLHRNADAGLYTAQDTARLTSLLPHLKRALTIRSRLTETSRKSSGAEAILDHIRYGVIVLSRSSEILMANHYAETVLTRRDGLMRDRLGHLAAASHPETQALAMTIAECRTKRMAMAMRISRPSGAQAYELLLTPVVSRKQAELFECGTITVFLRDPEQVPAPQARTLHKLYDLTPAEAQVAVALAGGASLNEIAETSGRGLETIRTHLRTIFQKTGTTRQSDLVRLLTAIGGLGDS
jgi:DNA-binding CsgD family transcriptional regulator